MIVNYVGFILALALFYAAIESPENISNILGQDVGDGGRFTHIIIISIIVIGTGYNALRQLKSDLQKYKTSKRRK